VAHLLSKVLRESRQYEIKKSVLARPDIIIAHKLIRTRYHRIQAVFHIEEYSEDILRL